MNERKLVVGTGRTKTRFGFQARFAEGLYRVADHSFAWMVPNGSWGETNLGLVRFGERSLLIDTCWSLPHMREVLESAAPVIESAPIELVINTHADGDHCWGNQLFEGRQIVASQACIDQIHHLHPRTLRLAATTTPWLGRLPSSGVSLFGNYMKDMLAPYDFKGISIRPPTRGFSKREVIQLEGEDIILSEVGPGHTDGDVIVEIPSRRVAYCGDVLFVGVTPVMWAGPVEGLVAALEFVLDLHVDVLVPGHGPLASKSDVQDLIDYWSYVREQLHPLFKRGMPAAKAAQQILLSDDYQKRPWARWDVPERLVTNALALYRQWGKKPGRVERTPTGVMWQQARAASALRDAGLLTN